MTLTQTAVLVKQAIAVSLVALVLGVAAVVGYNIWYAYYLSNLPPVEEKPDTRFGILPAPDFPEANVSSSNFSYSLDTVTGGLPKVGIDPGFEKIIKVYFVTQTFATFLSPQKSEELALKFGITEPADILSETKYKFSSENKSLIVDLNSGNFLYSKEATISANLNPLDQDKLILDFKQILSFLSILKDDLNTGKSKVIFLKKQGEELVPTQIEKETQAAQISLWPSEIDKKVIFTSDFNKSLVAATVYGNADQLENYLSFDYTYYPVDTTTFATYPIKTTEDSFNDLKNGKGVIIIEPQSSRVSITAVSLGYFLSKNYTPYLLPIFVFEGPGFAAYVPAINEQFFSGQNQPN